MGAPNHAGRGRDADVIVPSSLWDNMDIMREQVLVLTLQFDDALDPEILRTSLIKLKDKKLELHVPPKFTDERPAIGFAHQHHEITIAQHELGSKLLSKPGPEHPEFHTPVADVLPLCLRPGNPRSSQDYLTSDEPVLSLFVVSFLDATLVSLTWPHCAWDMSAQKEIMDAWRCVLDSREDEIKPAANLVPDILLETAAKAAEHNNEAFLLQNHICQGWKFFAYLTRIIWESLWGWNNPTPIVLSVPPAYLRSLREEAVASGSREEETGEVSGAAATFLSDGDILTAWTARLSAGAVASAPSRSVTLLSVFDVRGRLPAVYDASRAYLQNCVLALHTRMSPGDLPAGAKRLGVLAGAVRASIVAQTTPVQVALHGRIMKEAIERTGNMPLYGDQSSYTMIMSNWTGAGHFGGDFAAAARNGRGVPVRVHGTALNLPPVVSCWHILGKDQADNYWVIGRPRGVTKEMMLKEFNIGQI
ncbi:hypothetical protein E8E14_014080 [Neopestalotiopsis sp. 37M]|nr:hypothetical protein E8E14_014080 [Neopestalotiopsis sp. 37M]